MDRRKTILTVVITLFVIVAILSAGYAVYRLGYVQGTRSSTAESLRGPMYEDFGSRSPRNFEGRFPPQMPHGDLFFQNQHMPMYAGLGFGLLPGFLLLIGVFALVILAINSFKESN